MRILLFSSTYAPQIGGVETVTRRLGRELSGAGHDVSVYTNRYPRSLPGSQVIDGLRVTRRLYPNILPSPGPRSAFTLLKQVLLVPWSVVELFHLWRYLGRARPDVVNVHYFSYPAAYALIAARLRGVPVVLCFHGSDVASSPYPASYHWTMSWACSVAQVAVTCSENLLQYLRQDLPATLHPKTRVSHYGVDVSTNPSSDRFGSEPLPPNFIFLPSRLVAKKSVDVAIRAVALLKKRGRGVHLAIAGEGPLRAQLQALASDLDLSRDVSFLGSVSHRAAQDLMSQAAFVVVPSSWEAFGQVCLEAMAAAKAVVGSNNGGIGEIVLNGTTGLLVPPHDPDSLAAAIDKLAGDPGLSRQMGLAGRRRVEAYFTWAQMVDRYEQSFAEARRLSRVHRGSLSG